MNFKVNSYSIFNNYWHVMPLLLRVHFSIFPKDWQLRIYHDTPLSNSPYEKVLEALSNAGLVKTVFVEEPVLKCRAMLWRMIPVWDPDIDFVFCKDADSIPTPRERKIMEEFIVSGKPVLGINDNPGHNIPLMGGMIGFNTKEFIRISGIHSFKDFMKLGNLSNQEWTTHGADQVYLNEYLLPRIKNEMILYRTFDGASSIPNINCKFDISTNITFINNEIDKYGDIMICYIGASGCIRKNSDPEFSILQDFDCLTVLDFFDKYGDQEVNEIIREKE